MSIRWWVSDTDLTLEWTESNGPLVAEPTRTGFGNRLVETTVVRQFKGTLEYRWIPAGLAVAISIPAGAILA